MFSSKCFQQLDDRQNTLQVQLPCQLKTTPRIQRGFPVDIVRNTNLLTYLLKCHTGKCTGVVAYLSTR